MKMNKKILIICLGVLSFINLAAGPQARPRPVTARRVAGSQVRRSVTTRRVAAPQLTLGAILGSRQPVQNSNKASCLIAELELLYGEELLQIDKNGNTILHCAVKADFEDEDDLLAFKRVLERIVVRFQIIKKARSYVYIGLPVNKPFIDFMLQKNQDKEAAYEIFESRMKDMKTPSLTAAYLPIILKIFNLECERFIFTSPEQPEKSKRVIFEPIYIKGRYLSSSS